MVKEFIIKPQSGKSFKVRRREYITIVDLEGKQVVDFFSVSLDDHSEFFSSGVTVDCNGSLKMTTGDSLYSNLYREMFKIVEDDVKEHDLLHPCCRPEMFNYFYNTGFGHRNCLDNINEGLEEYGITKYNLIQPFNIFMKTIIKPDGKISVEEPASKPGDKIKLLAELDVVIAVASCSVSESKCNGRKCTSVKVIISDK